jgi:hypothetical protein
LTELNWFISLQKQREANIAANEQFEKEAEANRMVHDGPMIEFLNSRGLAVCRYDDTNLDYTNRYSKMFCSRCPRECPCALVHAKCDGLSCPCAVVAVPELTAEQKEAKQLTEIQEILKFRASNSPWKW